MTTQIEYTFKSNASQENTFDVLRFSGEEGLSTLFRFELELRSLDAELDLEAHAEQPACFKIERESQEREINGILSEFDALYQQGEYTIYRAVLVPSLWKLKLYHTNEIYLDCSVSDIISTILEEAGFTSLDFTFELYETERKWDYRCQYNESHFDFISRITEREGIYYYFKPDGSVVFTDNINSSPALKEKNLCFSQQLGLSPEKTSSLVNSLIGTKSRVPSKVILRDFNDETPSVDVLGEAQLNNSGIGEVNVFGQNIVDVEEGNRLAKLRAEEIITRANLFHGDSDAFRCIPGYTCELEEHFRKEFNQEYCILNIEHRGYDPRFSEAPDDAPPLPYSHQFTWLPRTLQFRPELKTPLSEIKGTLRALVDSEGDGEYAEIDTEGRYKVILPFDRRNRNGGKSSHWVRMMQPFGGENQGMHFPMRRGARVLLSFIGGDPDQPVISGAIPDASQPSVVTGENQTNSMIKTAAGNKIEIEDKEGSNRIKLETNHESTYFHLGAPNHDGSGVVLVTQGIQREDVRGGQRLTTSVSVAGSSHTHTETHTAPGSHTITDLGFTFYNMNPKGVRGTAFAVTDEIKGGQLFERRKGDKYLWTDGNEYIYGDGNIFNFGNTYREVHSHYEKASSKSGIDHKSKGIGGIKAGIAPGNGGGAKKEVFDIPYTTYNAATGCYVQDGTNKLLGAERWNIQNATVEKVWSDLYSYQNGLKYFWENGRNYHFGSRYIEQHSNLDAAGVPAHTKGINHNAWPEDKQNVSTGDMAGHQLSLDGDQTIAKKTLGNTYDYFHGNSLAVKAKSTTEKIHYKSKNIYYKYGGRTETYKFQGTGTKIEESWAEKGESELRHFNRNGVLDKFEKSSKFGALKFSTVLATKIPTLSMAMDFSQLDTAITTSFASKTAIKTTLNAFSNTLNFGLTGGILNLNLSNFGVKLDVTKEKAVLSSPFFKARTKWRSAEVEQKATAKIVSETLNIIQKGLEVRQNQAVLTQAQMELKANLLTLIS